MNKRPSHRLTTRPLMILGAVLAAVTAVLVIYSQTLSWFWDEGFHLLAAQLINSGKRPYADFFYQHVPLYAYANAEWMRWFGQSWRATHLLSAVLTSGAALLAARFVFVRLSHPDWRVAAAAATALFTGFHILVLNFGGVGQPYGLCLFLMVVGLSLTAEAATRATGVLSGAAGFSGGAAAASSLLCAPAAPILLAWLLRHSPDAHRLRKCGWFLGGAAVPFLPFLWLAARAPRQTWFDVVRYHLVYRAESYPNASHQDLKTLVELLASGQDLLLFGLAGIALVFLAHRTEWESRQRSEFYLCAWLSAGLAAFLAAAHPTYLQYFVLLIPFLSILAGVGMYAIGVSIAQGTHPAWLVLAGTVMFAAPAVKTIRQSERSEWRFWQSMDQTAQIVNRVTPKNGAVWANECVLFAARRSPPPGFENYHARLLHLPPDLAGAIHAVPRDQIYQGLTEGRYATVVIQSRDPAVETLGLPNLYARCEKVFEYDVFSGWLGHR